MIKLKATVHCDHYEGSGKNDGCLNQTEITLIVGEAKAFTDNGREDITTLEVETVPEGWHIVGLSLAFCPTHK